MFPHLETLKPGRIKQKLGQGRTPAQIALMFSSNAVAWEINSKIGTSLESFVRDLQEKLILEQEEKVELLVHIANNNHATALDKLCGYIKNKPDEDIIEFIEQLEQTTLLAHIGHFLRSVLVRCLEVASSTHSSSTEGRHCSFSSMKQNEWYHNDYI